MKTLQIGGYLTLEETAARLGVSCPTLLMWRKLGRIPTYTIGRRGVVIKVSDAEKLEAELKEDGYPFEKKAYLRD